MAKATRRVVNHPILGSLEKRDEVVFTFDGVPMTAMSGDVIASALLAHGIRALRTTSREHRPRSLYCAIGHCFDCQVTVDGRVGVRACLTPVRAGMEVRSASSMLDAEHEP